jgi:hypothetical protein
LREKGVGLIVGIAVFIIIIAAGGVGGYFLLRDKATGPGWAIPSEYGVEVSISPREDNGLPGETLTFTVAVNNTGALEDNYYLEATDNMGWGALLDENTLTIMASKDTMVTVSVTVPSDASEGDSTMITVIAISGGNPTVRGSATCTATTTNASPFPLHTVPLAIGVAMVGGGIVIVIGLLRRKRYDEKGNNSTAQRLVSHTYSSGSGDAQRALSAHFPGFWYLVGRLVVGF